MTFVADNARRRLRNRLTVLIFSLFFIASLFSTYLNNAYAEDTQGSDDSKKVYFPLLSEILDRVTEVGREVQPKLYIPLIYPDLYNLLKEVEWTTRIAEEHESNIFFAEDNEDSDIKTTVYQGLSLKVPKESSFFQLNYGVNFDYYNQEADHILSQDFYTALSYKPFEKFSIGVSDSFQKVGDSSVRAAIGDRLLALGYNQNRVDLKAKYNLNKDTYYDASFGYYRLDVSDANRDDFIDRNTSTLGITATHQINPNLSTFAGYEYEDIKFRQTTNKSSLGNRFTGGITKKFPNLFTVTGQIGYEDRDIETQRHVPNVDFTFSATSLFSTYTKLYLLLELNRTQPSSRTEFTIYSRRLFSLKLEHFLTPKLVLSSDVGYEEQKFEQADAISATINSNRYTRIYSFGATLKKIINDWLSTDIGYKLSIRNTEFATEGYTDHRLILGLTSNY